MSKKECMDRYRENNPWRITHQSIRQRCLNKKCRSYARYGGRGIKLLMTPNDFKFLWFRDKAYLMKCPSIHRINHDSHYQLDNCMYIEWIENTIEANSRKRKKVMQYDLNGVFIRIFESITDANKYFNKKADNPGIKDSISHKNGQLTAFGSKWSYENYNKEGLLNAKS